MRATLTKSCNIKDSSDVFLLTCKNCATLFEQNTRISMTRLPELADERVGRMRRIFKGTNSGRNLTPRETLPFLDGCEGRFRSVFFQSADC